MRQHIILGVMFIATACGSSKDAANSELDKKTITLDPPAGTYSYNPWVMIQSPDAGFLGSDKLKIKAPGSSEFIDGTICLSTPYGQSESDPYCIEVTESGTLAYYLENSDTKSQERSAEYKIELVENNVSAEGRPAVGATAEKMELTELKTYCNYDDTQKSLWVFIQTKNELKIGADKLAYVIFKIKEPKDGLTVKIDKDSDYGAGLQIMSVNDADPGLFDSPDSYSTKKPILAEESWPDGTCEVDVVSADRAKVTKGKISCNNLGPNSSSATEEDYPLGKYLDLSLSWQCDSYK